MTKPSVRSGNAVKVFFSCKVALSLRERKAEAATTLITRAVLERRSASLTKSADFSVEREGCFAARFPPVFSHKNPLRRCRSGMTLLEIVLSLAIFGGAMVVLSQLASTGSRSAVHARLKTQATIRCEAKLNEVLAGIEPMQSTSGIAFPDNGSWTWSQVVTPSAHPGLVQLHLTVSHRGTSRLASVDVTLRRWAREQALFVKAVEQVKEEEEASAKPQ